MKRKIKKLIAVLTASCMIMALLSITSFAGSNSKTGTYNSYTYRESLEMTEFAIISIFSYGKSAYLEFSGSGRAYCGSAYYDVICENAGTGTQIAKTSNPPNSAYSFDPNGSGNVVYKINGVQLNSLYVAY